MGCTTVIGIGMGLALCAGASGGVTITPVGPEGSTHFPRAMNECGDVVFDVDWGEEYEWAAGNTLSGPELVRVDGTAQRFTAPGADFGYSVALGEDGSVVGQYAYRFPGTEGYDTFKWKSAVNSADGADVVYTGPSPFACFNGVTLGGAYFGSGSNPEYLSAYDPASPRFPIAWNPVDGETLLRLPSECVAGEAQFGNPAGGYVGWAYTEELLQKYLWWDAQGEVTGSISMDAVEAIHEGGLISFGGVRGDGAIIGAINHRLMAIRADGSIETFGATYPGEAILEDVNAHGLAVGITYEFGDALSRPQAILWSADGDLLELQSLLPEESPWLITNAIDITESGDILVHAVLREDSTISQAFIIRGIPTPGAGSVAIGVVAVVGVMRPARRRA